MQRLTSNQAKRVSRNKPKAVKVIEGKAHAQRFDKISASLLNKVMNRTGKKFTRVVNDAIKLAYLKEFGGKRELAA